MSKAWDGNFKDIPLDHFEKMKAAARELDEKWRQSTDAKTRDKNIFICIGMTGTGIRPNYQVELPGARIFTINGINHEEFGVEEFNKNLVSRPYSIEQLNSMRIVGGYLES